MKHTTSPHFIFLQNQYFLFRVEINKCPRVRRTLFVFSICLTFRAVAVHPSARVYIVKVIFKIRIERRKEHKKHDFGIFYICIRSMNHHKNDRKARYTSRSRGYCRNFRLAFYINYAISVVQPADRVFDIKSQEIVTPIAVNLLRSRHGKIKEI